MINIMNPNGEVHSPSFLVEEIYKLLIPNIEKLDQVLKLLLEGEVLKKL